jgi:radical SAM protein with 4Fe4S-binding SPASM domain
MTAILDGKSINIWDENVKLSDSRYIDKFISKNYFSAPNAAYLELTNYCNLRCKHCFNSSGIDKIQKWPKRKLISLLKQLFEAGVFEIRFTGGEPVTYNFLIDAIKVANSIGLYCSLGTNGTLIGDDVAKKLKKAGLRYAVVSLDGVNKTHDLIRGDGNFLKAMRGIKSMLKAGISVRLNMTVMKTNFRESGKMIELADSLGASIVFRRYIPMGNSKQNVSEMLSQGEYREINKAIASKINKTKIKIFSHYLNPPKRKRIDVPYYTGMCSAGISGCAIRPNGDVLPCGVLALIENPPVMGNLNENSFSEIWHLSKASKRHRKFMNDFMCKKCEKSRMCSGSCTELIYKFKNDPYCSK